MEQRNFMDLLQARWDEGKSVCVGLDSKWSKLPAILRENLSRSDAQLTFNRAIVDATADLVCAYKPNPAFYRGGNGKFVLRDTVTYINKVAPGVPVILDAKQGDIGKTNDDYVEEDFDWCGADAVTVHPYLGSEALRPFLDQKDKGTIVLVRTSNPGADEFQDLVCEVYEGNHPVYADPEDVGSFPPGMDVGVIRKMPLYQAVAGNVAHDWNDNGNCAVVVGATYPDELAQVREIVGDMPILIPGIGDQGGDLEAAVKAGKNSRGQGMILNSSGGVIFASAEDDYAEVARKVVQTMHDEITAVLMTA